MSLDPASIYSSLYARAATDSAGAALRGLLGTNGVFKADDLGSLSGKTLPYLVWRDGGVGGPSATMRDVGARWFAYHRTDKGEYRLHQIVAALDALYGSTARFAIADGRLSVTFIGSVFYDRELGLNGIEVRINYRRLG